MAPTHSPAPPPAPRVPGPGCLCASHAGSLPSASLSGGGGWQGETAVVAQVLRHGPWRTSMGGREPPPHLPRPGHQL